MFQCILSFMKGNKKIVYERLMILFAGIVQIIGFAISITIEDFSKAFVPYFEIIVPLVNGSCAGICFILVVFPKFRVLQSVVLFVQGIVMTLNNMIFLGVFLYCLGIVLLFCYGYLKSKQTAKIAVCTIVLFISFLPILYKSTFTFCMALAYLFFVLFSYFHLYFVIKENLLELFPFLADKISNRELPEPGSAIKLADYGLSERQITIIKEYKKGAANYKKLAGSLYTSESTIKQEMSKICKNLGVKNVEMLLLVLNQYEIE